MRKQKKLSYGLFSILMTICILAGVFFAHPVQAEAAAFKVYQLRGETSKVKVGKYYLWYSNKFDADTSGIVTYLHSSTTRNGKGKVIAVANTASEHRLIEEEIISDGSTIYYGENNFAGDFESRIYRVNVNGKNRTCIAKMKRKSKLSGYYNGTIYLNCDGTTSLGTYQLNTKTKKVKCIMKNAQVRDQYNRYLLASPMRNTSVNLFVYDCKAKKKVRISSKSYRADWVSGKVYYAEKVNSTSVCIKSCSPNGKNKKTLVRKLSVNSVGKITSKYVYYSKGFASYYRYNFKTKKSVAISQDSYLKACLD